MGLVRLGGVASLKKIDFERSIDWRPEMRLWPESDFEVIDVMEGIEGGEKGDPEDLNLAEQYFIKLTEECDEAGTDSRIDN